MQFYFNLAMKDESSRAAPPTSGNKKKNNLVYGSTERQKQKCETRILSRRLPQVKCDGEEAWKLKEDLVKLC